MNKKFPEHKEFNLSQINKEILEIWDKRNAFQKKPGQQKKRITLLSFLKGLLLQMACPVFIML